MIWLNYPFSGPAMRYLRAHMSHADILVTEIIL